MFFQKTSLLKFGIFPTLFLFLKEIYTINPSFRFSEGTGIVISLTELLWK